MPNKKTVWELLIVIAALLIKTVYFLLLLINYYFPVSTELLNNIEAIPIIIIIPALLIEVIQWAKSMLHLHSAELQEGVNKAIERANSYNR